MPQPKWVQQFGAFKAGGSLRGLLDAAWWKNVRLHTLKFALSNLFRAYFMTDSTTS